MNTWPQLLSLTHYLTSRIYRIIDDFDCHKERTEKQISQDEAHRDHKETQIRIVVHQADTDWNDTYKDGTREGKSWTSKFS